MFNDEPFDEVPFPGTNKVSTEKIMARAHEKYKRKHAMLIKEYRFGRITSKRFQERLSVIEQELDKVTGTFSGYGIKIGGE